MLAIADIGGAQDTWDQTLSRLRSVPPADMINLRFFVPQSWLRFFYAAADAVLGMSGHEPFGLVGLEAMAAGGVVFTGATGEEYGTGGRGVVVVDTDRPEEVVMRLLEFRTRPDRASGMRDTARARAADFTWDLVADILLDRVSLVVRTTGALPAVSRPSPLLSARRTPATRGNVR
jgi:glycosyltransferase involved in cell wall biosynthesis